MFQPTTTENIPPDLLPQLRDLDLIVRSYMAGLTFAAANTSRDEKFREQHLFSYLLQDLSESAISIVCIAREGLLGVARRELQFLLESSIKICFIQQQSYSSTIEQKLSQFHNELSSQKISIKNNLQLKLLAEELRAPFCEEVGRLYGAGSDYVHLSPAQVQARIAYVEAGGKFGRESAADIEKLNNLVARTFAASLVILFHAVPEHVAGDWFVEGDGKSTAWYFAKSRYLASIDAYYDYKHERKQALSQIQIIRASLIAF